MKTGPNIRGSQGNFEVAKSDEINSKANASILGGLRMSILDWRTEAVLLPSIGENVRTVEGPGPTDRGGTN